MKQLIQVSLTLFLLISLKNLSAQNLTEIADDLIKNDSIPEIAFAVVTKDSILISKVIGYHKIDEKNEKSTACDDDYFHLGSNTKAITGFIAACLVEQNKINWDTKFFDLFPESRGKTNPAYFDITLEDLLTHQAKLQSFAGASDFKNTPNFGGEKRQKRTKFVEYVLTLPVISDEKTYNYSNAGYSVASVMLEKVSGKSWEDLVLDVLKNKLHINYAIGWPNRNFENQPWGHWIEDGKLVPVSPETDYNLNLIEPGGDLSMQLKDYIKFIQLNIKGLSGEDNIIKSETYKYIHNTRNTYAIGWENRTSDANQISTHAGSDGSFLSYVQIDRNQLIGYIVIMNCGSKNAEDGIVKIIKQMKSKYGK